MTSKLRGAQHVVEKPSTPTLVFPKVLIVAPGGIAGEGINQVPEIDAISNLGYQVRLLQGNVTDERLYSVVQERRYDIVHFMVHGNINELGISGSRLSRNAVLQIVRMTGARVVFLNACNSVQIGQTLVNAGTAVVIASVVEVPDADAWQTAVTFYTTLAEVGDVSRAYKAACAGPDVQYVMLADGAYVVLMAKPVLDKLDELQQALGDSALDRKLLHKQMELMTRVVIGVVIFLALALIPAYIHLLSMP